MGNRSSAPLPAVAQMQKRFGPAELQRLEAQCPPPSDGGGGGNVVARYVRAAAASGCGACVVQGRRADSIGLIDGSIGRVSFGSGLPTRASRHAASISSSRSRPPLSREQFVTKVRACMCAL